MTVEELIHRLEEWEYCAKGATIVTVSGTSLHLSDPEDPDNFYEIEIPEQW